MSARLDLEAGPVAVGLLVGLAGLLFLATPLVGPVSVGGYDSHSPAVSICGTSSVCDLW